MDDNRFLLVVSGPSGCGKDTVVRDLIEHHLNIELAVSATTRTPRDDEQDGLDYFFITREDFEARIARGEFAEYTQYVSNYYGTLKSQIAERVRRGVTCVLVIEVEGAANIRALYPGCTTVFVLPPSMEELERRLRNRGTEAEERLIRRLLRAKEEMELADAYDFHVFNDDAHRCAEEIYDILKQRQQLPAKDEA